MACASIVATAAMPAAQSAPAPQVVIVPGQTFGALPYQPLAQHLDSLGYRTTVLDLPGHDLRGEPARIAATVNRLRAQHPGASVSLIGHSIGGLTARWYLDQLGGNRVVDKYIAIGTPQYGSPGACGQEFGAEACPGTPYLRQLNAGINTAGTTQYFDIRNEREWVDGHLTGRQCRVTPIRDLQPLPDVGLEHTAEPFDPEVWQAITDSLAGKCDGVIANQPAGSITAQSSLYPGRR